MPSEDTQWKPGQSGNPGGRIPLPPEVKRFKRTTHRQITEMLAKYWNMEEAEVKRIIKDPKTPAGERIFANIFLGAMSKPDTNLSTFILDRLVGKVKDEINITSDRDEDLAEIPREKLVALIAEG